VYPDAGPRSHPICERGRFTFARRLEKWCGFAAEIVVGNRTAATFIARENELGETKRGYYSTSGAQEPQGIWLLPRVSRSPLNLVVAPVFSRDVYRHVFLSLFFFFLLLKRGEYIGESVRKRYYFVVVAAYRIPRNNTGSVHKISFRSIL